MSFTNFYLIAGSAGSADINAGSTIGAAVGGPATSGSWTNATNTFVAASGTPFASAAVGDYVSIYADGATVTTYVAQIVTKVSSASVILSSTIKYGTAPTDGANNRSAVLGGSWNTEQVLAAGGLASTTVPQSTKINIKGNLTITANRIFSMAGATTTPLWFSGYNTNPNDLDNDTTNSLAKPIWTVNSTLRLQMTGAHQTWSGISFTGNVNSTNGVVLNGAANQIFSRIRVENTNTSSSAAAFIGQNNPKVQFSWFKSPTTATIVEVVSSGSGNFIGCVFEGGGFAGLNVSTSVPTITDCIFLNNTGNAILITTGSPRIINCTIYNSTSDGIKWTGTPSGSPSIISCLFAICGGIGINASAGTTNVIHRACNDFYSCSGGAEAGFGDSPAFFQQSDSSSPVVSATDMTPLNNAVSNGFPQVFEGGGALGSQINAGLSIGAVQVKGGGSAVAIFGSE